MRELRQDIQGAHGGLPLSGMRLQRLSGDSHKDVQADGRNGGGEGMKKFPHFLPEAVLLLLAASSLVIPLLNPAPFNFAVALLTLLLAAMIFGTRGQLAGDFDSAIRRIQGMAGWDSRFVSAGTLILDYNGEKVAYRSLIGRAGKTI